MNRKQKSVTTSITEAEYMAMSTCAKKSMWLVQLFKNLGYIKYLGNEEGQVSIVENEKHQSTVMQLKGNNQAANHLRKDVHIHERSKHIDVAYHHVRDLVKKSLIQLDYIASAEMIVDGLTKPLTKDGFKGFTSQLSLTEG